MGYRCIRDPVLLKEKGKPEYGSLRGGPSKDPRVNPQSRARSSSTDHKRKLCESLPIPKFRYDSTSLGPPPRSYLLIKGFSSLVTPRLIHTAASSFGKLETCQLAINEQMVSLGAARIKFAGNPIQSHQIANKAVQSGLTIEGQPAIIEWDESKAKFDAVVFEANEKLQNEMRNAAANARRQREAESNREKQKVNDRARRERHIYIHARPHLYTHRDLLDVLKLPIEPTFYGYCIFENSSDDAFFKTYDEVRYAHCRGVDLRRNCKIRYPIDRPHSESSSSTANTAPPPEPHPSVTTTNVTPGSAPTSLSTAAPEDTFERMIDEFAQAVRNDQEKLVTTAIARALIKAREPKNTTKTFVKRKPEKLGDLRLHFQRKRPKIEENCSAGKAAEDVTMDSGSESLSEHQTAPSSVDEHLMEFEPDGQAADAKKRVDKTQQKSQVATEQQMVNEMMAGMHLEKAPPALEEGTVRGRVPVSMIEETVESQLYLSDYEHLLIDEHDFLAARKAIGPHYNAIKPQFVEGFTSMYRDLEARHRSTLTSVEEVDPSMLEAEWTGGFGKGWKSRGYTPIDSAKKAFFLPHRRKIEKPHEVVAEATSKKSSNTADDTREARNTSRRQVRDLNTFETDSLSFNQLLRQSKKVRFAQSSIHNWGLYASEPISVNEMIIEYVGEIIRSPLADIRERYYCLNGIGSSYLFRVDQDMVIDATKRGNIARLINHSCTPSCIARVIKVGGKKRICIYAAKYIQPDDELTYDYRFEQEDDEDRIPCLCGTVNCKGFLN